MCGYPARQHLLNPSGVTQTPFALSPHIKFTSSGSILLFIFLFHCSLRQTTKDWQVLTDNMSTPHRDLDQRRTSHPSMETLASLIIKYFADTAFPVSHCSFQAPFFSFIQEGRGEDEWYWREEEEVTAAAESVSFRDTMLVSEANFLIGVKHYVSVIPMNGCWLKG